MKTTSIKTVYVWQNGMVMVFNQRGEQMPRYQGHKNDVLPKLRRLKTQFPHIEWHEDCEWPGGA